MTGTYLITAATIALVLIGATPFSLAVWRDRRRAREAAIAAAGARMRLQILEAFVPVIQYAETENPCPWAPTFYR